MEHVWYFLKVALYPIAAIVVCGFVVWACQLLFIKILGRGGYKTVLVSSVIGTPIHDMGHAIMCLLFGHRIEKMVLWQPRSADGTLGYVQHTYNRSNLYHRLGNLFIGTGPIFSGMAVLCLGLYFAFPGAWSAYSATVMPLVARNAPVTEFLSAGVSIVPHMLREFGSGAVALWAQILAVLVMLSVSLHINLSPADIKGSLNALVPYLVLALLVTVVTTLIGAAAKAPVLAALMTWSAYMMALFTVVLTFAAVQVVLALIIRLIVSIFRR